MEEVVLIQPVQQLAIIVMIDPECSSTWEDDTPEPVVVVVVVTGGWHILNATNVIMPNLLRLILLSFSFRPYVVGVIFRRPAYPATRQAPVRCLQMVWKSVALKSNKAFMFLGGSKVPGLTNIVGMLLLLRVAHVCRGDNLESMSQHCIICCTVRP